jgi:hypothetical protein
MMNLKKDKNSKSKKAFKKMITAKKMRMRQMPSFKCNSKWLIINCKIFHFKASNSKNTDLKIKKTSAKMMNLMTQTNHKSSILNTN